MKLLYASQIGTAPPTFAIVSNRPLDVPESYQRYLANGFREVWPFTGSPLRLKFTSRGSQAVSSTAALWLLASYLVGAIPTSYLAGRLFRGIDLREHGSKNLGATNVYRTLGWRYAIPVGLFDIAKGAVPVLLFAPAGVGLPALRAGLRNRGDSWATCSRCSCAFAAGRASRPRPASCWASRRSPSASPRWPGWLVLAAERVRLAGEHRGGRRSSRWRCIFLERPDRPEILWLDALVAAAIIWLHRANIRRLLNGTESRFGRRAAPPGAPVTRIAVLGAGSWGTTLANLLACKGDEVRLWAYEPEVVEAVNRDRENPLFLPGVPLSGRIRAVGDAREAVAGAEVIVSAPPSHAVRARDPRPGRCGRRPERWWSAPPRGSRPTPWR